MRLTGAELPTSLGQLTGVHRFRIDSRCTLNSSKSLSLDLTASVGATVSVVA